MYIINIIKSINGIDVDDMSFEIKYNDTSFQDDALIILGDNSSMPIEKCNDLFNAMNYVKQLHIQVKLNIRINKVKTFNQFKLVCTLTFQDIKDQVKLLIEKIKDLRYNNYIGNLYDCKENEYNYSYNQAIAASFYDLFKENENITLNELNCGVCIEPTLTRLIKCRHKICIKCIQKLNAHICPLCRVNIDCGCGPDIFRENIIRKLYKFQNDNNIT
jgi:hypothetical protein